MKNIKSSELILNPDGSIYHIALQPHEVASTILLVGDPKRVSRVSAHFDTIEVKKEKREFITHTGTYNGSRVTVISTGIGTDNIDIVINELDALFNIDLKTRLVKDNFQQLRFVRIGTSGTLDKTIPCDSFVQSNHAVGFDGLGHFYESKISESSFKNDFEKQFEMKELLPLTYFSQADDSLMELFKEIKKANTATMPGFYGPQGRSLRLKPKNDKILDLLNECNIHNFEMETAGIYFLSNLLGHKALSLNAIIANRVLGKFSKDPKETVNKLIETTLKTLF